LISKKLGKLMLLLLRKMKNYVQPHQHQTAVAQNRTVARFLAIQPVQSGLRVSAQRHASRTQAVNLDLNPHLRRQTRTFISEGPPGACHPPFQKRAPDDHSVSSTRN